MRMTLSMTNHEDGTATASRGTNRGVQIPVKVLHRGSEVSVASNVTRETFGGTIDAGSGEIVGTFTEGSLELPLVLHHVGRQ